MLVGVVVVVAVAAARGLAVLCERTGDKGLDASVAAALGTCVYRDAGLGKRVDSAAADAYRIVSQMVLGTAKLQLSTGQHPAAMKDAVCSPGGATIKGVVALEDAGMRSALVKAIDATLQ